MKVFAVFCTFCPNRLDKPQAVKQYILNYNVAFAKCVLHLLPRLCIFPIYDKLPILKQAVKN